MNYRYFKYKDITLVRTPKTLQYYNKENNEVYVEVYRDYTTWVSTVALSFNLWKELSEDELMLELL